MKKDQAQRTRTWHDIKDKRKKNKYLVQHWILLLKVTLRARWHDEQMGIEMVVNLLVLVVVEPFAGVNCEVEEGRFRASLRRL